MLNILLEQVKICEGWKPQTMGSGATGDWLNLKGYSGVLFIVSITQGNASGGALTVDKAKATAGTSPSAGITMNNWAACVDAPQTSDAFTKGAAAASIATSATGSGSSIYLIDVPASDLGDTYNCVRAVLASSSASNISACQAVLYGPRNAQAIAKMLSGIAD